MTTETISRATETEALLMSRPHVSMDYANGKFSVFGYWPPNDILRGKNCLGQGATLADALAAFDEKLKQAKRAAKVLKTAAECKDAVIALIREHEAAPASFRDAVDALPVEKHRP